jgi:hypothetical protein
MQILIKIIGMSAFSAISGLLTAALLVIYFKVAEKIQFWSEKYSPPKNWPRRILHLVICILAVVVIFYSILFWLSMITDFIKAFSEYAWLKIIFFIFFVLLFGLPSIALRRYIFREMKIKKLWE